MHELGKALFRGFHTCLRETANNLLENIVNSLYSLLFTKEIEVKQ